MAREMKDSGTTWIDQIPKTWDIVNLRHIFSFGKGLPITKNNLKDTGIPVISYGQIHSKANNGITVKSELIRFVDEEYLGSNPESLVKCNDFIVADTSEDLAGCGNAVFVDTDTPLFAGYHTIILRNNSAFYNKYFAFLFQSDAWRKQIRERVTGVKLFSISQRILRFATVLLPPIEEQKLIADYLEDKCSHIDTVIEQTQASIEEHKKLKQAIIAQAVTKGIRPNRLMKDSGIEWVGEIPVEWESINPKALFAQRKDKAVPGERQLTASQQYGVIYQDEYMALTGSRVVTVEKDFDILKHVEAGDFVISMRSFQGGLEYSTNTGSISSAYVMLVPNLEKVFPRYYRWLLKSSVYINALQSTTNMVRDGQAMRYANFIKVRLFSVPLSEQEEIANYLDDKCAAIDRLIGQKERLLAEMESFKRSLIYEYVTGKKEVPA